MRYFDYESVSREVNISEKELQAICAVMREEFPHDDMMWELHVLRACTAIRDGHLTVEQVVSQKAA